MKKRKVPTVAVLKRNDVDGVIETYKARAVAGVWTYEDAQTALMLQDDPTELIQALSAAKEELDPPLGD